MNILDKFIKKPEKKQETTVNTSYTNAGSNENKPFTEGLVSTKDIIAPSALEVDFNHLRIDNKYYRTLFVAGYPRFVGINWLSSLINFDASLNISMYIYPTDGKAILDDLRRKITEMEAELSTDIQRGRIVNPATQAKLEDALNLQADLVKGEERFFQYGLYITITANSKEELDSINKNIEAALGSLLIVSKKATLQMEDGFITTLPICEDRLQISRNMDTTSLATTFPFVSSDLSDDKGVMYGINASNGSLVIFDRFSMPNYNSVVFATAGAGKSYLIKLEALRSLMLGTEIIVIDPENEYKDLCEAVGGQYVAFGYGESSKINPFDLSLVEDEGENALNTKVLTLHKLFKIMLGNLDPLEESLLDKAVMEAYKMKGITPDPETQNKEAPLIEDLYKSLIGMEDQKAQSLAARFEKYIKGSFAGIFNQKTTVNLNNQFVVFGIKNLEDALRPVAMQIILDYIWTVVKKTLKKRILIVDEAWYLMQYEDSAGFLRGIVKRGRKYYLGVTTITQDVDDFLKTNYGKEIVTNSAIQILLKQHSAAIDQIGEVFYLSEGEKQLLLSADKGQGIFFAGQNHVAINVISSEDEHKLISSNPEDVLKNKKPPEVVSANKPLMPPIIKTPIVESKANVKPDEIKQNIVPIPEKPIEKKPEMENKNSELLNSRPEVVVVDNNQNEPEKILQDRIGELEKLEKKELENHELKKQEEIKNNQEAEKPPINSLPKYQDLFKSPLEEKRPQLPKFEEPIMNSSLPSKPNIMFKPEVVTKDNNNSNDKKPLFISQNEVKVPQPPQLSKNIKPEFVKEENKEEQVKNSNINNNNDPKKLKYEDIFGNGIV